MMHIIAVPVVWLLIVLQPGPVPGHPVQSVAGQAPSFEACMAAAIALALPRRPGWHVHCYQPAPGETLR